MISLTETWKRNESVIKKRALSSTPCRAPKLRIKLFPYITRRQLVIRVSIEAFPLRFDVNDRNWGERRGGNFVAQTRVFTFVSVALPEFSSLVFVGSMNCNQLPHDHHESNYIHATRDFNLSQLKVIISLDQSRLECREWQAENEYKELHNWAETYRV